MMDLMSDIPPLNSRNKRLRNYHAQSHTAHHAENTKTYKLFSTKQQINSVKLIRLENYNNQPKKQNITKSSIFYQNSSSICSFFPPTINNTLIFVLLLLLINIEIHHATPVDDFRETSRISSGSNAAYYNTNNNGDSASNSSSSSRGSSSSSPSSDVDDGGEYDEMSDQRTRLAKMEDADTPLLQSLMRDLWHWRIQDSPEYATMVGLNDNTAGRLDSFTQEHFDNRKKESETFLSQASQLQESKLNFEDQVNLRILKHYLGSYVDNFQYIKWFTPVSLLEGPQFSFPKLVLEQMTLRSYDDFQKLLSRYGGFPHQIQEMIGLLQQNIDQGHVPHSLALEGVLSDMSRLDVSVTESSFFKPFVDLPPSINTLQRRSLRQQAQERIAQDVLPAYDNLRQFLQDSYLGEARASTDVTIIEGGSGFYAAVLRYHSATSLTPDQIHTLGITELKRIRPLLKRTIENAGLGVSESSSSTLPQLLQEVREDQGRYFESADQLTKAFEDALSLVQGKATSDTVDLLTRAHLSILPSSGLPLSSRVLYEASSMDGARQAHIAIHTGDLSLVSRDEVTALVLYYGAPGQHLVSEYLRTSTGIPTYRRALGDVRMGDAPAKFAVYSSFVGGWSLYSTFLGEEFGLYDDMQRFGWQSLEATHTALMVVDTGIHHLGWSVDNATTFLMENTALSSAAVQNELRRVVTWPGLACSSKVGEIKIKELRQKAVNALGELFELRDFHSVVLKCAGPINLLQVCVDHYIDSVITEDAAARSRSEQILREQEEERRISELDASVPEKVPPDQRNSAAGSSYKHTGIFFKSTNVNYLLSLLLVFLLLV